jgi:hypothetical protein
LESSLYLPVKRFLEGLGFEVKSNSYDLIVYGLLDSHTLLSHGSSVRLDKEARSRLKQDGMISLSFTVLSESLGRKIFLMLQDVFDGRSPLCLNHLPDLERSELAAACGLGDSRCHERDGRICEFRGAGHRLHPTTGRSFTCRSASTRFRI